MDIINSKILQFIKDNPGAPKSVISSMFNLSDYRFNRALRYIEREFGDIAFSSSNEHGVWVVKIDRGRCLGMIWRDSGNDGYFQCEESPEFPDGMCYEHSTCESPEMTAFVRKLSYVLGPREPNPLNLLTLGPVQLEELFEIVRRITPLTKAEYQTRLRLTRAFASACATIKWKRRRGPNSSEFRMPPGFEERLKGSSINPFEYSLKKLFALLEIPSTSTREETLQAWKRLARRYHPDASHGIGNEEKMKELNIAKDKIFRIRRWN
ncbi:MAG: DnaJ domain-containing protein [Desulfomonilaceae bacterium]